MTASQTDEKIHCANCHHCKLVKLYNPNRKNQYVLRVRCEKKMWRKQKGDEKLYKYFTVARRTMDHCPEYSPMGDAKVYLKELRKTLPIKDEVYWDEESETAGATTEGIPVLSNFDG